MYTIKAWSNTGFDCINIPATPAILESMASKEFPALDLLQNDGLSNVSVRGSWGDVKDIDYVKIGDIYYAVIAAPRMTSYDVAVLSIIPDYITSSGGILNLSFTDGMVERKIFLNDDTWGDFPETDPYMAPAMPMQLEVGQYVGGGFSSTVTVCESTIDLTALADCFDESGNFTGKGLSFTDSSDAKAKVTIPYTEGVKNFSLYQSMNRNVTSPGTKLYDSGNANVKKALGALRAIGAESAIISQTAYPTDLIEVISNNKGEVTAVSAKTIDEQSSGLSFIHNTSHPLCLEYSNYCKYGIMTSSGSKMEAPPLMISPANGSGDAKVKIISDPRPDGKPYFRFSGMSGDDSTYGFWIGAVDGSQWASVPLIWNQPSGSYQSQVNYDLSANADSVSNYFKGEQYGISQASNLINTVGNLVSAGQEADIGKFLSAAGNGLTSGLNLSLSEDYRVAARTIARNKELFDYQVSQHIVTPSIQCPFNASMIRDYFGNGAITYRYTYHSWDLSRITRILRRFGNKKTMTLRSVEIGPNDFGYILAHGVQVSNDVPRFWKAGIAEQFDNGVRFWNKKPTET